VLDNVSAFQGDKYESGRSLLVWPGTQPETLKTEGLLRLVIQEIRDGGD
jgi:hypothetical protein